VAYKHPREQVDSTNKTAGICGSRLGEIACDGDKKRDALAVATYFMKTIIVI
jgi:hypothetical protein